MTRFIGTGAVAALLVLMAAGIAHAQDPEPHVLSEGPWTFMEWSPATPAGTQPANAVVRLTGSVSPSLDDEFTGAWPLEWNRTSSTRAVGLGADGIGFTNTSGSPLSEGPRYLGAFEVAIDTRDTTDVRIAFTAGTVAANPRTFALRLQARWGSNPFADLLDGEGDPVEYVSGATDDEQSWADIVLPAPFLDQERVDIRWVYYETDDSSGSGARPLLRLDDIVISDGEPDLGPDMVAHVLADGPWTLDE